MQPNVGAYLARIQYTGDAAPTRETLFSLQSRHLCSVPYENLDILRESPASLEIPFLFEKIVGRRRGGYCFELNGLFAWLLRALGYPVTEYFGRFLRDEPAGSIPMRRHRVLRVSAEGRDYLCDVGVGGACPLTPLLLEETLEQSDGRGVYRLTRDPFFGWVIGEKKGGAFSPYYGFTEEPQAPVDFVATDFYCRFAPDSPFRKGPMCAIQTPHGRKTLSGQEFRIFRENSVETYIPPDDSARKQALRDYFGLIMD